MTISIWRYSHLTLAISSCLFIVLATVTGIILAIEPINEQLSSKTVATQNTSIAHTLAKLQQEYAEVVAITINEHQQVKADVITKDGNSATFFINPNTGKKISEPSKRKTIYKFTTTLHRSLFLKSTGRYLVAFFSLLLLIISITGIILIVKKEGGITKWFSKKQAEDFSPKYHSLLGKYALIPIIIITLTGIFLSLEKFNVLPKQKLKHNFNTQQKSANRLNNIVDAYILKNTLLTNVSKIEFPFSDDEEDYFFIQLKTKEFYLHQFTGEVVSTQNYNTIHWLNYWSFKLHTGHGNLVWSFILCICCFTILFFIYSGFSISINRIKKKGRIKNKYTKDKAEIIILVGSETGSTMGFAKSFHKALLKANQKSFITSLNKLHNYPSAKHVIILTATYGDGDPPANADKFLKRLQNYPFNTNINYSIVGFGSLAYAKYCAYAIQVQKYLQTHQLGTEFLDLHKINNKSFASFKTWQEAWSKKVGIPLNIEAPKPKIKKQLSFKVTQKSLLNLDDTFTIKLKPLKKKKIKSGDLLSIVPAVDNVERLYSIGALNNEIILSIKKHEFGVCSNLLNNLNSNDTLIAGVHKNPSFHLPKNKKPIIFIANGTGIAPFIGMLNTNSKHSEKHLFWGCKTTESTLIYNDFFNNKTVTSKHIAYSREGNSQYIQDVIKEKPELISDTLKKGGTIMICGSIAMMNAVLKELDHITINTLNRPIAYFKDQHKIKLDCY